MVLHAFNLKTWEVEADRLISEFEPSLVYKTSPGQPGLHKDTLIKRKKRKEGRRENRK